MQSTLGNSSVEQTPANHCELETGLTPSRHSSERSQRPAERGDGGESSHTASGSMSPRRLLSDPTPNGGRMEDTHPSSTLSPRSSKLPILGEWIWEILAFFLAFGLCLAIVLILTHFNGQTVSDWRLGITLTTIIASMATVARASVLFIVAEVLGQSKWSWFSHAQPLVDMQHFDSASRGLMGSLTLLSLHRNAISMLGSLALIMSLAVGPFTQQSLTTTDCNQYVPGQNASIPAAHFMDFPLGNASRYKSGSSSWNLPVDMIGALINGVVNPDGSDSSLVATCQTGNCTFANDTSGISYSSIGLCDTCMETSSLVSWGTAGWTLPNGLVVSTGGTTPLLNTSTDWDMSWASSVWTKDFESVAIQAMVNFTVLVMTRVRCPTLECPNNVGQSLNWTGGDWDIRAISCALYPCLKNYVTEVHNGRQNETIMSTVPAEFNWASTFGEPYHPYQQTHSPKGNSTALKTPCYVEGIKYSSEDNFTSVPRTPVRQFFDVNVGDTVYNAPHECLYQMSWIYLVAMETFIENTLFGGSCIWLGYLNWEPTCDTSWWLEPLYNSGNATFETLSTAVRKFTTAITNKFRASGTSNLDYTEHEMALGGVTQITACTTFVWPWLLLPMIVIALSGFLLLWVVLKTCGDPSQPVWKSSVLPLLFYGPGKHSGLSPMLEAEDLTGLDKRATLLKLRWESGTNPGFMDDVPKDGLDETANIELDSLLILEGAQQEATISGMEEEHTLLAHQQALT